MKRLLSTMLILVLLLQALPVGALAASGDLLTEQELAAAIALTGIGADGAQSNAAYHKGMTPNETWNAVQVNDWLDEQLNTYMYSVEEILSRASVKLAELKQSDSAGYRRFSDDNPKYKGMIDYIQRVYQSAEALREEMRWQQDRLVEQSGLITELGRQYAEGEETMFASDRVRLSYKIREAEAELKTARREVSDQAKHWEATIQHLQTVLDPSFDGASEPDFPGGNVGEWLSELGAYGEDMVQNSAKVALVNTSGSRLGRMSANGSVLANDPKTEFTVLSENQFAIQLYTGKLEDNGYVRTLIRGTTRSSAESTPYGSRTGRSFGFVALSKQKDAVESEKAAESAIELFEWEMNSHSAANGSKKSIVLDKGYIDHFELIQSPADESGSKARRLVLYTARETTPDGATRERLYGLYIEPFERNGRDMTVNVTKYAYDLTLPTGKFSIFYIGDTPYIYWLATAPTTDNESEGVYRVWAAALDLSTNSMATPSVFAEFKWGQQKYSYVVRDRYVAEDQVNIIPHTVFMTGTGRGYFTAAPDLTDKSDLLEPHVPKLFLYSFQEQQKAVLEVRAMLVEDTTMAAGDFEDATILLMNAGNMGITKFDLEFYTLNNGKAVVPRPSTPTCCTRRTAR